MGHRWFLIIFGVFWTGMTLLVDVVVGYGIVSNLRSESFATTTGTVTHSEVTKERGSRGRSTYGVDIRYSYWVSGQKLQGDTYHYSSGSSTDGEWATAAVREHKVGEPVAVYYDEDDPANAVLKPGIDGADLFLLQFLTPFNVAMLGFWRYGGATLWHWWNGTKPKAIDWFHQGNTVRVRLAQFTPIENGSVAAAVAAFLLGFVCLFSYGFHPPIEFAAMLWAVVIGAGVASALWDRRKQLAGDYDLVIGERTVEVPAMFGASKRLTVDRTAITGVAIEPVERGSKRNTHTSQQITIQRRDGPPTLVAEWQDGDSAAALAAWLREKLGPR